MEKTKRNEKKNKPRKRNEKKERTKCEKNDLNIFWLDARMYSDLMGECQESRDKLILK